MSCAVVTSEQNAIIQAARHGVNIDGSTLYCTTMPCIICTKMLINAGIKRIVYAEGYADELAREMVQDSGIEVVHFERGTPEGGTR